MRTAAAPGCPAPKWGSACAPRGLRTVMNRPIPCTDPDFIPDDAVFVNSGTLMDCRVRTEFGLCSGLSTTPPLK